MRSEDRWVGIVLGLLVLAAVAWIVIALLSSTDLESGQAGFLRYALLLGLAGILGFAAAHFLGGDRGFAVFLASLLGGAVVWIVIALLGADLSPAAMTLIRYGILLGLAGLIGLVAGAFFGEDRGVGAFLGAVIAGAAVWILVAMFDTVELSTQGRANFGYWLFIGIPAAAGLALVVWKDGRERKAAE